MNPEQYIGYRKTAPPGLARFMRKNIIRLYVFAALAALLLLLGQRRFLPSFFEFGSSRVFEGLLSEKPYPTLRVLRPADDGGAASFSRYVLVARGKHGAQELVRGRDGQWITLRGALVFRDDQTMIELAPESIAAKKDASAAVQPVGAAGGLSLGRQRLTGEIVDSKCFFGVMNPGNLKPHRSCAVRCISGGIPPVFLVRDQEGSAVYLLLVSEDGEAVNRQVLDRVAEPLEIEGEVVRHDSLLVLKADPETYRRIP